MNLYNESDSIALVQRVDDIIKSAEDFSSSRVEPTNQKIWQIIFTVRDYVIEKKRKIYGGFALNKLIERKDPKDKFYDDSNVKSWDIDFYSPDPISDAIEISNRLKAKGFHHIAAREAQHEATYKIFTETVDCADITYVPRNIYNKIPFTEVNGLTLTGPQFMMIDYLRVLTDPLTSYFRLEKTFVRLCLMLKHYPLPVITKSIDMVPPNNVLDVAFHTIHEFLINKESTIVVGMYAYNHLIKESGISLNNNSVQSRHDNKQKYQKSRINYIDINYYEVITTNFEKDSSELILKLQNKFLNSKDKISYQECTPFFQYLGHSVNIYCEGEIICRMYDYNTRCTPYFDVPALYFKKGGYEEYDSDKMIRIGSFALLTLFTLINIAKAKVTNDEHTKSLYFTILSHMIQMKNYYLTTNNKTIFDKSLFQEFIIRCVGEMLTPQMEKALRIERRIKSGDKISWSYNPENDKDVAREKSYKHSYENASGNPIKTQSDRRMIHLEGYIPVDNETDDLVHDDANHEVAQSPPTKQG
jgi:hypothetical protein